MLECARRIEQYTQGTSKQEFAANLMAIDAVLHNLMIIGEASNQVPSDVRDRIVDVPWAEIRGMRNRLVHDYPGVDIEIVWQTIALDIPALIASLELAIETEDWGDDA